MEWVIGVVGSTVIGFFLKNTVLGPLWDKWQNKKKPIHIKELEKENNLINRKLEIRTKPIKIERNHDEFRDNRHILNIMFLLKIYNWSDIPIDITNLKLSFNVPDLENVTYSLLWYKYERNGKSYETKEKPLILECKKLTPIWFYCRANTDKKELVQKIWANSSTINIGIEDGIGEKYNFNELKT